MFLVRRPVFVRVVSRALRAPSLVTSRVVMGTEFFLWLRFSVRQAQSRSVDALSTFLGGENIFPGSLRVSRRLSLDALRADGFLDLKPAERVAALERCRRV